MPPTMNMPPQMVPPPIGHHQIGPGMLPMMPLPVHQLNPSIVPRSAGSDDHQQIDKRNEQSAPQGWRSRDNREKERDYRERDRKFQLFTKILQF